MRFALSLLIAIGVLVLAAVFGALNDQPVSVNYLWGQSEIRMAYVLLLAFLGGVLAGLVFGLGALLRAQVELRRVRSELVMKDKELNQLRTLPVRDSLG